MKDKQSVLLELEEIKSVRDELREQVTSMTTELEKERTKVHGLKDEMYKLKVRAEVDNLSLQHSTTKVIFVCKITLAPHSCKFRDVTPRRKIRNTMKALP